MDRIENEESSRRRFLMEGNEDKKAGNKTRQLTLRTWSAIELWSRNLVLEVMKMSMKN